MRWSDLWAWLLAPTGLLAALAAWLLRRRSGSGSWIGRRLAAEKNLATCEQEVRSQAASFARQVAALTQEIAQRERQAANLAAALAQLADAVDVVNEARNAGLLTPSLTARELLVANSTPGRRPRRARTRTSPSPSRPVAPSAPGSRGEGDEAHG